MWFQKSHDASITQDGLGCSSPWMRRPVRGFLQHPEKKVQGPEKRWSQWEEEEEGFQTYLRNRRRDQTY